MTRQHAILEEVVASPKRFSRREVRDMITSSGLKIESVKELMSGFAIKARKKGKNSNNPS